MALSASFTFSGVVTPLAKKSVAAATPFTAEIDDLSGVGSVTWAIIGTDGVSVAADYTLTPSGPKNSIVTITSLTEYTGAMLEATVTGGGFTDKKRALFYVPSSGSTLEPLIYNELFESDSASAYVTKQNVAILSFDGAAGFNPQAPTVNLATTGAAGTTNLGTRAGETIVVGSATASFALTATGDTFFDLDAIEFSCSSSFTVGTVDEAAFTCDSFAVTAAALCSLIGDEVEVRGESGISIAANTTSPTRAIGVVDISGSVSVKIDGVRFDHDPVSKGNGTTLEAGRLNVITGTAWTLPALSGVAAGESVWVLHSLSTGTITRGSTDVINAGSGHATDTTYAVTDQQRGIRFQNVSGVWSATMERSANAASAGGSSITDGTGTLSLTAGALAGTGITSIALTSTAGTTLNSIPIRLPYAVRVLSTSNIANLTTVTTVDSVTLADQDLVGLVAQSTPTQNGLYRFTLATTTLARATAFDNLAEYHLGTQMRAYAGTANVGKAYQLTALSSSLPATWADITGSGGGGGASITDGTGTLGIASAGDLTSTGLASVDIGATGAANYKGGNGFGLSVSAFGETQLDSDSGEALSVISGEDLTLSATNTATVTGTSLAMGVGSSYETHDVSGANRRIVTTDAAGSTACTDLYDNAACTSTYVGTAKLQTTNCSLFLDTLQATISGYNTYVSAANQGGILATSSALMSASSGPLLFESASRIATFANYLGTTRISLEFPAAVTPGSNAATGFGTSTMVASRSYRMQVGIQARLSAGNYTIWAADLSGDDNGTTASGTLTVVATPIKTVGTVQGTGAGAPLASTDFDVTFSGHVATIRVANAQGVPVSFNALGGQSGG